MDTPYRTPDAPPDDLLATHCERGPTECTQCLERVAQHHAICVRAQVRAADALARIATQLETFEPRMIAALEKIDATIDLLDDHVLELVNRVPERI